MDKFLTWDWAYMNKNAEAITKRWNEVVGK